MKRIFTLILSVLCLITAQTAWAYTQEELSTPLTLEFPSGGTVTIANPKSLTIKYRIGNGDEQTAGGSTDDITITVSAGDKVQLYGNGTTNATYSDGSSGGSTVISCSADCYIYGNIMSLVDETDFATNTSLTESYTFAYLFNGNSHLKNHSSNELVLPATTLANYCYLRMFSGCTALTTAPELPAETLKEYCYQRMFSGCTGLTTAPDLPATTLVTYCYMGMFYGCTGLNYVKCLATDLSATECTTSWLNGVAETGTFVKAAGASWKSGVSGIPQKWTVYNNIRYTIQFDKNGGSGEMESQTFYCGDAQNLSANTFTAPEGKVFNGWNTKADGSGTSYSDQQSILAMTTEENATITLYAQWVDIKTIPLTLDFSATTTTDEITVTIANPKSGMKYAINGGTKTAVSSVAITVSAGDKVQFYGNGTNITSYYGTKISCSADCYIYGNIMSLVDETGYATNTALTVGNTFVNLFNGNTCLKNHDTNKLVLPATQLAEDCYLGMFQGCTGLTAAPALPATQLEEACYQYMFSGCTDLTKAPELPATTLAPYCYQGMFNGCSKLNYVKCLATDFAATGCTANWLSGVAEKGTFVKNPAATWDTGSTSGIPSGWTATIPDPLTLEFPSDGSGGTVTIKNLQDGMKYSINNGDKQDVKDNDNNDDTKSCIILLSAGQTVQLYGSASSYSGTKIQCSANCYIYGNIMSLVDETGYATKTELEESYTFAYLFDGNTYLKSHPTEELVLPATTLAKRCYYNMFKGCTNLTTAPALPAETLTAFCYANMFNGCTGLTKAPKLPATTLADGCYNGMFNGTNVLPDCSNIDFKNENVVASGGLKGLFAGTAVTDADLQKILPTNNEDKYCLPVTTLTTESCYESMFRGCTKLTTAPALPATTLTAYCYQFMFEGCTGLTTAPALPATTLANNCYQSMFDNCTNLTTAPALPATTLADYCYYGMFYGCTGLTTAPALPATTLTEGCYRSMFAGCTSLTTAPTLPATTLANLCYNDMFSGCTNLATAPELPATTLADDCYSSMFWGCTKLNYVKCLATDLQDGGHCKDSWLNGVASFGTFVKNSAEMVNNSSWSTGINGIPSGWTVVQSDPDNTQQFGAVTIYDDGSTSTAIIDGSSEETVSITSNITVNSVIYTRTFTSGVASTIMLPFEISTSNVSGGTFYTFGGVSYDNTEGKWVCTMQDANKETASLTANTPYLFMPSATGQITFTGGATFTTTGSNTITVGDWTFTGTYAKKTWTSNDSDKDYGFAATSGTAIDNTTAIEAGQFVRLAPGAWMKPMRAYLYVGTDTAPAPKRRLTRGTSEESLPSTILVRLVDANGETTSIGELNTQTGELSFDGWYDLKGRKLEGEPTKRGIYIFNGKKVLK